MTAPKPDEKHGKTFADFFDGLLNQPKKLFRFSGMLLWVGIIIVAMYFLLLWLTKASGLNPTELQFSALGSLHFESTVNGKRQILLVVQPQGWQDTQLLVKAGQRLSFEAVGRVSIDLQGLVSAAKEMNDLETDEVKRHPNEIDKSRPPAYQKAPEDFFNEDPETRARYEKLKSNFSLLWAYPEGLKDQGNRDVVDDKDYPGRTKNKAMPDKPYGALIGAIIPSPNEPVNKKDFFFIGKSESMYSNTTGRLWLNINDVIDPNDPVKSKLYYFDNVGFFWVKITFED